MGKSWTCSFVASQVSWWEHAHKKIFRRIEHASENFMGNIYPWRIHGTIVYINLHYLHCLLVNRGKSIMNGSYGKCNIDNIVSASFSEASWDAESYGHNFCSLAFAIRKFPFLFTTVPFWHKSAAMWCVETMTQMHRNRFRSPAGQPKKKTKKNKIFHSFLLAVW